MADRISKSCCLMRNVFPGHFVEAVEPLVRARQFSGGAKAMEIFLAVQPQQQRRMTTLVGQSALKENVPKHTSKNPFFIIIAKAAVFNGNRRPLCLG
jgi:hypothetical protein